jgi:hypothetical protein
MRHIVRPFKIEFKSRSSRSTPMRSPTGGDAGKDSATSVFNNAGVFSAGRHGRANAPDAAMKAAHSVFGRTSSPAPATEALPASNAPAGRVLPSLIENGGILAVRPAEADQKAGRSRAARKAKAASPARPRRSPVPAESGVMLDSPKQAATKIAPETPTAAPDRERRSAHKRRLLDAELKAGERWKRRLCRAAR